MAQDRTGPGFGLNQDPYEVERREMRSWAEQQAETRRRSGIDGPGIDPAERSEYAIRRMDDGRCVGCSFLGPELHAFGCSERARVSALFAS